MIGRTTYIVLIFGLALSCTNPKKETKEKSIQEIANPTNKVVLSADVAWEQLNPARGDKSPLAGTLWGDRKADVATGYLGKFVDGFSSPPHIHNVSYRAVVIKGSIHNDDPTAEKMWMQPGSFWTQPEGESHITAAKGDENMAYIEIDQGPYLVMPTDETFDNGERPINLDKTNIVWLASDEVSWIDPKSRAEVCFLWESEKEIGLKGLFVKLPKEYKGIIESIGDVFYSIVIDGEINYKMPRTGELKTLDQGSCFSSQGKSYHTMENNSLGETILYIRTDGKIIIN